MQKKLLRSLAIICIIISCNNNSTKTAESDSIKADNSIAANKDSYCYLDTTKKDSIFLHITISNNKVTGNLKYKIYQKDANSGTITGEIKGDTLIADYSFMSEGKQSLRQVAFLKKGNDFVEGYGAAEQQNKKMIFTNLNSLKFNGFTLKEVDCK